MLLNGAAPQATAGVTRMSGLQPVQLANETEGPKCKALILLEYFSGKAKLELSAT
jgi:hypothetical protein